MIRNGKNSNFKDIVGINMRILTFFGIIPPDSDSLLAMVFYVIRVVVLMVFFFTGLVASELGYMYINLGDVDNMASVSFLMNANFLTIILYYYIFKYRNRIKRLVVSIDRPEFQPKTQNHRAIQLGYIRTCKIITISLQIACTTTCLFWGVYPYTVKGGPFLPTTGYIPYDTDRSPVFEITFLYEIIATICSGFMNTSALSLIAGFMMVVCAQLAILNDSLERLKYYAELEINGTKKTSKLEDIPWEISKRMDRDLMECIVLHKHILQFTNDISVIFGKAILGQYLIVVAILCTALFQMTKVPVNSIQFFSYVCFTYCATTGIFILCFFGNTVSLQSSKLTGSAFSCGWPECSCSFKRNLLIFMCRTQRHMELYAGNVFSISLENFIKIVKSAVSYFTVLQQFSAVD